MNRLTKQKQFSVNKFTILGSRGHLSTAKNKCNTHMQGAGAPCCPIGLRIFLTAIFLFFLFSTGCHEKVKNQDSPTPSSQSSTSKTPETNMNPESLESLYQKGKDAQMSHDIEEAMAVYKKILEKDPNHFRARKRLGEVYYMTGEYEPAIREFKKVLKDSPSDTGAVKSNLILCYLAVDRPENAMKYISPEIDRYSRWGTHYSFKAQALYSMYMLSDSKEEKAKLLQEIKTQLKKGTEDCEPEFGRAMLKASLALFYGEKDEIITNFRQALSDENTGRDRVSILFLLGALEAETGKQKESLQNFREVTDLMEKAETLEFQNFMDGFYSLWALDIYGDHNDKLAVKDIRNLVERIPGGIKEPEMNEFIGHIESYIEMKNKGNFKEALTNLKAMENSIKDESIEGDYFYDGIYKPFIMNLLYTRMSETAQKAGDKKLQEQYKNRGLEMLKRKFPE